MALTPATSRQVPEHAIMDLFGKQAYLANQFILNSGVVVLGDTAEHPVLYLNNGQAKTGNAKGLFCSMRRFSSAAALGNVIFRTYWNPTTVTGGSTVTPIQCRNASPNTTVATALLSPSVGANGTFISATAASLTPPDLNDTMLIADAGVGLLITAQAIVATSCIAEFVWWEI